MTVFVGESGPGSTATTPSGEGGRRQLIVHGESKEGNIRQNGWTAQVYENVLPWAFPAAILLLAVVLGVPLCGVSNNGINRPTLHAPHTV